MEHRNLWQSASVWSGIFAAGVSLAACEAQASAQYKGEPLLSLSGHVTVDVQTDGLPITPALCFLNSSNRVDLVRPDELPAIAAADFSDHPLFWPQARVRILDVDSIGQFPADFNVAVYLPPPEESIQPQFNGEPRMARGQVCAVRADHPDLVSSVLFANMQSCASGDEGTCHRRMLWMTRESQRYYTEAYECPSSESALKECLLSTDGDAGLKREFYESVVGMDPMRVVYLAEPAAPDSYTAWEFGANSGLATGYHLFSHVSLTELQSRLNCAKPGRERAQAEVNETFAGHIIQDPKVGIQVIEPAYADAAHELYARRTAQSQMKDCDQPPATELSPDEPLSIEINKEWVTLETLLPSQP